jgi:hypothetical protein
VAEQVLPAVRRGLGQQVVDELAAAHRRQTRNVEDGLLRVHRGDLAARLGNHVHDRNPQPVEARVVRAVQTDRTGADDQDVDLGRRALVR